MTRVEFLQQDREVVFSGIPNRVGRVAETGLQIHRDRAQHGFITAGRNDGQVIRNGVDDCGRSGSVRYTENESSPDEAEP